MVSATRRSALRNRQCCSRNSSCASAYRPVTFKLELAPLAADAALLHGHCHQKAFDAMPAVRKVLRHDPGTEGRDRRIELLRHGG